MYEHIAHKQFVGEQEKQITFCLKMAHRRTFGVVRHVRCTGDDHMSKYNIIFFTRCVAFENKMKTQNVCEILFKLRTSAAAAAKSWK